MKSFSDDREQEIISMKTSQKIRRRRIPWWFHIIIATALYLGLTYWLPTLSTDIPWLETLLHAAPNLAPIASIAFLLLGAKALYDPPEGHIHPRDKGDV